MNTIRAAITLTRWKEYILFVVPLTLLGPLISEGAEISIFDSRLYAILIGNLAAVAFAFMINDVEDAEDDKLITEKLTRNPVSSGALSKAAGYTLSLSAAIVAFSAFFYIGGPVLWLGSANLLTSYLYSGKPVRLKKWPLIDIVSHAMMLGSLLVLTAYYTYSKSLDQAGYLVAAAFFISSYGQLYNQLRDFDADRKAGLKNTSITLGKTNALRLTQLSILLGLGCILIALSRGVIPAWLIGLLPIAIIIALLYKPKNDITERSIQVKTGNLQFPSYLAINIAILAWFMLSVVAPGN